MKLYRVEVVLVVLVTCYISCLAEVYNVGDKAEWSLSVDYSTWTSGKTFKVGDSLVFTYGSSHTVAEVSSDDDYRSCNVANSIASYSSSPTTVVLNTTGTHYFICGAVGHCSGGMKVSVLVTGTGATPGSSPANPTPTPTPPTGTSTGNVPASSPSIFPALEVSFSFISLVLMFVLA